MKILIGIGASDDGTGRSLIRAFQRLGHQICCAGAVYGRKDTSIASPEAADIDLPDKPYPETYTYKEVLDKAPWTPDFILQLEPHFYFVGDKPKGMKSYYYVNDPHRGGVGHRNMARSGNFNAIFITQSFFAESYITSGMECFWIPAAFDTERIVYDPSIKPECDIAFIGQTGIREDDIIYNRIDDDGFEYCAELPDKINLMSEYNEYAERAVLIANLMREFDVRIYKRRSFGKIKEIDSKTKGTNYSKIIQKGIMGFHRSLFKDITLRPFEIAACKRVPIIDDIPNITKIFKHTQTALIYKQFGFSPHLSNFTLEYEMARRCVMKLIEDPDLTNALAGEAYRFVHQYHTYENRVQEIIEIVNEKS